MVVAAPARCGVRQVEAFEEHRVDGDDDAGAGHGERGDLWPEPKTEGGNEDAGGDGSTATVASLCQTFGARPW